MQLRLFETLGYHFQKRIVVNLYESAIREELIALQLDLEIPTLTALLKSIIFTKGIYQRTQIKFLF
jgi:hypothetical protein